MGASMSGLGRHFIDLTAAERSTTLKVRLAGTTDLEDSGEDHG